MKQLLQRHSQDHMVKIPYLAVEIDESEADRVPLVLNNEGD
jgi:hypothetical protein